MMLRPALLLPPKGLLTPRFDRTLLNAGRWPATRRSGAYLGGTHTRWLGPAFRTRHIAKIEPSVVHVQNASTVRQARPLFRPS